MNMSKIILLGYMFLILIVSLIIGESLVSIDNLSQDKIHHFIEYSILGVLGFKEFLKKKKTALPITFFGTFFGFFNEVIKMLLPARTPSFYDLLANLLGVSCDTIYSTLNKKNIL